MSTVSVVYVGGSDAVHIPSVETVAKRGEPIRVSAALAGRAPGPWHERTEDDAEHWPIRLGEDGSTVETFDPGEGLLAQVDIWQPAPAADTDTKKG